MAETLLLQLVSPERSLVEEQVTEVQVPALDGFIGVLPGHAPLVSELKPGGVLSYRTTSGEDKILAVYGGFVEVTGDRVRVLADGAEPSTEIDLAQAQRIFDEARKNSEEHSESIDPAVALDEMLRAQARLEAATRK